MGQEFISSQALIKTPIVVTAVATRPTDTTTSVAASVQGRFFFRFISHSPFLVSCGWDASMRTHTTDSGKLCAACCTSLRFFRPVPIRLS